MPPEAPPLPQHLQVEVSGACNLRCRMCLVRYAPAVGRREGALAYEDFLALVDSVPQLKRLTLQGLGEPLLSPHLLEMIRHAARRGVHVGFNTNGVLLSRAVAKALVAAGTSHVHVSLDGASAATYEDVRHGTGHAPRPGQFERVVANLRGLLAARGEARRPRVVLVFVAMRRNVEELEPLVDLAADLGVDELWVQNLSHVFSDTDPAGAYDAIRHYAEAEALFGDPETAAYAGDVFARAGVRAREHGLTPRLPRLRASAGGVVAGGGGGRAGDGPKLGLPGLGETAGGSCSWPWEGAYVTHRGDVQPCCMVMGSDRATLGRLGERPFTAIWHGDAYRRF